MARARRRRGCGRVGAGLARACEEMGHTVAVIDRREKAFGRLRRRLRRARRSSGVGFDRDRLRRRRHRAGRRARRRHQRRQLEHPRGPGRPGDLRHRAGRRPHLRPPPGRHLRAARHPHHRHRAVGHRAGAAPHPPGPAARRLDRPERQGRASSSGRCPAAWAGHPVLELEVDGAGRGRRRSPGSASPRSPTADLVAQEGDVVHVAVAGDASTRSTRHLAAGPTRRAH